MRSNLLRWSLAFLFCAGLVSGAIHSLRSDDSVPDMALESVHLLKKKIEDLLPDLQEDQYINEATVQQATLDLDTYQDLQGTRERWNEMRALIEAGESLNQPLPSEIAVSTSPIGRLAPAIPPPPGFTVQLPYESRLTVSGRKTIGISFQSTSYTNAAFATEEGLPVSQSSFLLQQQLQVRINGQIGRKVTVNVDFDDTKEDKKDISIVYKGDPDEVVQRAAFGDIQLSLPQTEFVGYSKQVFGAEAELKYGPMHGYIIGSRTKGTTETKQFVGNVILQRLTIPDISYVRRKYYSYQALNGAANDKGISLASLQIYLDTQDVTRSSASLTARTVDYSQIPNLPAGSSTTYAGNFITLAQGVDYTIDTSSGIITFKNQFTANSVVAVDYVPPGSAVPISQSRGIPGLPKAIKWDETIIQTIPAPELDTFYNLGAQNIVRDNGQGNFTLQLRDLNNNPIGTQNGIVYLPNNVGQIVVDFTAGQFYLKKLLPFPIYNQTPTTQSSFYVEFQSTVKTYVLRPNIVLNSEHITMNGRLLTRDVDYFIDYQSGYLTFFNTDQITPSTLINATYDFSPFGIAGAQEDTLVGARAELSLYPLAAVLGQSLIGSTVLYDFSPQQTSAPDIRQTSGNYLVSEADVHLKDLIFDAVPFLKSSFSAEGARSAHNPNSFGKALIENMEGIADNTSLNLSQLSWQLARNPDGSAAYANAVGIQTLPGQPLQNIGNEAIATLTINPNASALPGDQTTVLDVKYDLTQSTEASLVTVISPTGVDFTKKLYLEMYIQGDGSAVSGTPTKTEMGVTMGQINEDADATGGGGTVDQNNVSTPFVDNRGVHLPGDGTPRTEDVNYNGTLDANEDTGWAYTNPDKTITPIGINNLRLDSEDLNRNGVLDRQEINASQVGYLGRNVDSSGALDFNFKNSGDTDPNAVDFSGWQFVRVPLEISSNTASAVQELRVTLRAAPGFPGSKGLIRIGKLSVVGNKWMATNFGVNGSTVTTKAVNNQDDAVYQSPGGFSDFNQLNQVNTALTGPTPNKIAEQSLAFDYEIPAGSSGTATSVTTSAMDFTDYGTVHFFLYKNSRFIAPDRQVANDNGTFFFRVGSDTDYLEFDYPVSLLPTNQAASNNWIEININQEPQGNSRPTYWVNTTPGGTVVKVGNPDLANVAELTTGVNYSSGTAGTYAVNELWVDEVFAGDAQTRIGYAAKLASDFELFGWAKFGGDIRDIDRNFQTITSPITNQDLHQQTSYLNITRIPYFPINFTQLAKKTDTPNVQQVGNSSLISVQQAGLIKESAYTATGVLQIPRWPKLNLLYDHDDLDSHNLFKNDVLEHYGAKMDYVFPLPHAYLPRTIHLEGKLTREHYNFYDLTHVLDTTQATDPYLVSDTKDNAVDVAAKLAFEPVKGFTFNPQFSRETQHESKNALVSTTTLNAGGGYQYQEISYNKLGSQSMGFDGVFGVKRWFSPRYRYTIANQDTYGIPLSVDTTAYSQKNVDRTSTGEVAWDFAWRDFSKSIRPLQSLNIVSNYLVEDGDSWNSVDADNNSLFTFWIPKGLGSGARQNQTIRDTFRSVQRWNPFDWATGWSGFRLPLRTLSLTSTYTDISQRTETTDTPTQAHTRIVPDLIMGFTQTEYFFHAQNFMSNSQMNIKTQYKIVDTVGTSREHASTNGGDWRFTLWRKLDLFVTYTQTSDVIDDLINHVVASDSTGSQLGMQAGFNVGKWRFTPKYDQSIQKTVDSSGNPTNDLTTRTPALQLYADLFLPAGLKLPFSDLVVFSNRIRTTNTISYTQKRSSLNTLLNDTDTYQLATSEDYEMTSNIRLTVGGSYAYTLDKESSDANFFSYTFNTLLTIQF